MKKLPYLLILLVSCYQFLGWLDPSLGGCNIGGFDCSSVTESKYGLIAGLPLSLWAILWSSVLLILNSSVLVLVLNTLGLAMAFYSLTIMGLVLQKWCLWCLVIDINLLIIGVITFLNLKEYSIVNTDKKKFGIGVSLGLAIILSLFGVHKLSSPSVSKEVILSLDSSLVLGNISGKNTLVVFTDFQCPACKKASDIVKSLIKRGDTKVLIKNYPLSNECNSSVNHNMHPWSCLAAVGSECAFEQGKFDEFYNTVYGNQASIHTKEELLRTLSFTSINMSQFDSCVRGSWAENKVQQDIETGNKINIQGTPTLYYNGQLVPLTEFLNEK